MFKSLESELKSEKNKKFITDSAITLTYKNIEEIGIMPRKFLNIQQLHLSHNKIKYLDGIEQLEQLKSLSIKYNLLEDWRQLLQISNKHKLLFLRVKGNPLTVDPSYQGHLLQYFENVENLDDLIIDNKVKQALDFTNTTTSRYLIQFLYHIQQEFMKIDNAINRQNLNAEFQNMIGASTSNNGLKKNKSEKQINKFTDLILNSELLAQVKNILIQAEQYIKSNNSVQQSNFLYKMLEVIMPNFQQKDIDNIQVFNEIYKQLFKDLLLRYSQYFDKHFLEFLKQQSLQNNAIQHDLLETNHEYALNCYLLEFYHLLPSQAHFNDLCIDQKPNPLLVPRPLKWGQLQRDNKPVHLEFLKGSDLEPKNLSHHLAKLQEKNKYFNQDSDLFEEHAKDFRNPVNLKEMILQYFPIFPLNIGYMQTLYESICGQLRTLLNAAEIFISFQNAQISQLQAIKQTEEAWETFGRNKLKRNKGIQVSNSPLNVSVSGKENTRPLLEKQSSPQLIERKTMSRDQLQTKTNETERINQNLNLSPLIQPRKNIDLIKEVNNYKSSYNKLTQLQQLQAKSSQKLQFSLIQNFPNSNKNQDNLFAEKNQNLINQQEILNQNEKQLFLQNFENMETFNDKERFKSNNSNFNSQKSQLYNHKSQQYQQKLAFFLVYLKNVLQKKIKSIYSSTFQILNEYQSEKNKKFQFFVLRQQLRSTMKNMKEFSLKQKKRELYDQIRLKKFFNLLKINQTKNQQNQNFFYQKSLKLKVIYGLLKMVCQKRKIIKGLKILHYFQLNQLIKNTGFAFSVLQDQIFQQQSEFQKQKLLNKTKKDSQISQMTNNTSKSNNGLTVNKTSIGSYLLNTIYSDLNQSNNVQNQNNNSSGNDQNSLKNKNDKQNNNKNSMDQLKIINYKNAKNNSLDNQNYRLSSDYIKPQQKYLFLVPKSQDKRNKDQED